MFSFFEESLQFTADLHCHPHGIACFYPPDGRWPVHVRRRHGLKISFLNRLRTIKEPLIGKDDMVFILWLYIVYLWYLFDNIEISIKRCDSYSYFIYIFHINLYLVFKSMKCYGSYSIILWFIYDNFVIFLISNFVVYNKHRVIQIQKLFD